MRIEQETIISTQTLLQTTNLAHMVKMIFMYTWHQYLVNRSAIINLILMFSIET